MKNHVCPICGREVVDVDTSGALEKGTKIVCADADFAHVISMGRHVLVLRQKLASTINGELKTQLRNQWWKTMRML